MGKIYSILTERKLTKPPLEAYIHTKEFLGSMTSDH